MRISFQPYEHSTSYMPPDMTIVHAYDRVVWNGKIKKDNYTTLGNDRANTGNCNWVQGIFMTLIFTFNDWKRLKIVLKL